MKALFLFLILLLTFETNAQIDTVYGNAYRNIKEYKENSPFIISTFVFEKISGEDYYDAYDIVSVEKKVKKKVLRHGIWIVDAGNYFYVNITRYGYREMFIKFKKLGNYYYFKAEPQLSVAQKQRALNSIQMYGSIGVAVTTAKAEIENLKFWSGVLDFDKGYVYYMTKEYIEYILNDYPDLKNDFRNETEKENPEVMKLYLNKVNEKYNVTAISK